MLVELRYEGKANFPVIMTFVSADKTISLLNGSPTTAFRFDGDAIEGTTDRTLKAKLTVLKP